MNDTLAPADRLVHVGMLHDSTDEIVATALEPVHLALARDDPVFAVLERCTARRLRDALGTDADRVTFWSATQFTASDDPIRVLRDAVPHDRPCLVVGQYSSVAATAENCAFFENGVNLVLRDLPMTLLCAGTRRLGEDLSAVALRSHPYTLVDGGRAANPDFLTPSDHDPVPSSLWGPCSLRVRYGATGDLQWVRRQVARVADEVGLRGDETRAAVLAIHEAAVRACEPLAGPTGDLEADCFVEVRTYGRSMFAEVHAPRRVTSDAEAGGEAHSLRPRLLDPLRPMRSLCRGLATDEGHDFRVIRVLTGPGPP